MTHHKIVDKIEGLLNHFDPISLKEMEGVSLLNRTDTKYIMSSQHLYNALEKVQDRYRVLGINQVFMSRYQTLYFDTNDFKLYKRHHNGGLNRYKVRCRKYVDSDISFMEVKFKSNKGRTIKKRMRIPDIVTRFEDNTSDFLYDNYPFEIQLLEPKIQNAFVRTTLVSKYRVERLTIDLNLRFQSNGHHTGLPDLVIAEVKQEGFSIKSDFVQQMRAQRLHPTGFSKYCMGMAMMYPELKSNRFKPKFLLVNKLTTNQKGEQ